MGIESVKKDIEKIYDHFQVLTVKCVVSNILFAGAIREMRWLPATVTGVTFALSASIGSHVATDITRQFIPTAYREKYRTYCTEHSYLHGVYFASFFAISLIGSTVLTQAILPFFGRSVPVLKTLSIAALDLIPFYLQMTLSLFPSLQQRTE